MRIALLLALLALPSSAVAQWKFTMGGEGPKFGYAEQGSNNFYPFWIYCEVATRRVVANAYVGERKPANNRVAFTVSAAGEPPATVGGIVEGEPFDGLYSLTASLAPDAPLLALLAKGKPVTYSGGTIRANLAAQGMAQTVQQWKAACRF